VSALDEALKQAVTEAIEQALGPYLRRLSDPEPLVYSVKDAAHVLSTSTTTVRRLIDQNVLPTVPHMGHRIVIPRWVVDQLVRSAGAEHADGVTPILRAANDH
jgi:excisionase family DNA binding protein